MLYLFTSDLIVLIHFAFILFVVFGGFLSYKWPKTAWFHIPAVVWGGLVELLNLICPLTRLENLFRYKAGILDRHGDFIQNHLFPIMYPDFLTREIQVFLGLAVLMGNLFIYLIIFRNKKLWEQFLIQRAQNK